MKVLVISAAFPPMRAGEADHALHLCRHLADRGLDVHVLTTNKNVVTADLPFKVYPIMRSWSWRDAPRFAGFLRRCAPEAVLLFHIGWVYNDYHMITFAPTLCKALFPGVPFVTVFDNPIGVPPRRSSLPARVFHKGLMQWPGLKEADPTFGTLLRDSDRVIVLSERHRTYLSKRYPPVAGKSIVIPPPPLLYICPEDGGAPRQRGRERIGVKAGDFVIAYFGFIYPNKGVETLLQAFRLLSDQRSNARLILVGGIIALEFPNRPSYAQEIRELPKRLAIDDKVTWTGEYAWDSDEASVYLRAADLCVLPFDTGVQLNNSSVAAVAAHGLPIITTQGTTLEQPFVHRENVFLCAPRSPEAMAAAIKMVMDDPELRARLRKGTLKLAQERFSWESATELTVEAFSRASDREPAPSHA
jgi:glycosyltransferase involved in cell wall biosynthesis